MQRQHLIAGGVALLIAVVSGVWFGGRPSEPVPAIIERGDARPSVEAARITIHVSGAVVHPGLVELDADSRVADALAAAGGALQEAELSAMNLAAPLADGTLIVVPERGTPTPAGAGSVAAVSRSPRSSASQSARARTRCPNFAGDSALTSTTSRGSFFAGSCSTIRPTGQLCVSDDSRLPPLSGDSNLSHKSP